MQSLTVCTMLRHTKHAHIRMQSRVVNVICDCAVNKRTFRVHHSAYNMLEQNVILFHILCFYLSLFATIFQ